MSIENPIIRRVFDDLDKFRDFCRFEAKVFNEADCITTKLLFGLRIISTKVGYEQKLVQVQIRSNRRQREPIRGSTNLGVTK